MYIKSTPKVARKVIKKKNKNQYQQNPMAMEQFPDEWHGVIHDTTMVDDPEERISVRAWSEFFGLQEQGFTAETAAMLVFGDKAEELIDAITLSKANV